MTEAEVREAAAKLLEDAASNSTAIRRYAAQVSAQDEVFDLALAAYMCAPELPLIFDEYVAGARMFRDGWTPNGSAVSP